MLQNIVANSYINFYKDKIQADSEKLYRVGII